MLNSPISSRLLVNAGYASQHIKKLRFEHKKWLLFIEDEIIIFSSNWNLYNAYSICTKQYRYSLQKGSVFPAPCNNSHVSPTLLHSAMTVARSARRIPKRPNPIAPCALHLSPSQCACTAWLRGSLIISPPWYVLINLYLPMKLRISYK